MNGKRCVKNYFFYFLILSFIIVKPAYAYLDPGAGSVILQGIIAAIAAVAIVVNLYWHKILVFLGIRKKIQFPEKKSEKDKKPASAESDKQ